MGQFKRESSRIALSFFCTGILHLSCISLPFFSHSNIPLRNPFDFRTGQNREAPSGDSIASLNVPWEINTACKISDRWIKNPATCEKDDTNFIALSLSGGGSRAAIFSAAVMFELQNYTLKKPGDKSAPSILHQTDVISSASGGSVTSALYSLSCDSPTACPETVENTSRLIWQPDNVFSRLSRSFQSRWLANLFWPDNFSRLLLTDYDRTDVLSETISDNLYDTSFFGGEPFRFHDLNKNRPNLVINASDNTENVRVENRYFTFTNDDFAKLNSDVRDYTIGAAVAASSAYPGVFGYVTLKDYGGKHDKYRHLFDAGTYDNLGLHSVRRIMEQMQESEDSKTQWKEALKIVILVDSHTDSASRKGELTSDTPSFLKSIFGMEFLNSYDSILASLRYLSINTFNSSLRDKNVDRHFLIDLSFDSLLKVNTANSIDCPSVLKNAAYSDPRLYNLCLLHDHLNRIPTQYRIDRNNVDCLQFAAKIIVNRELSLLNTALHESKGNPAAVQENLNHSDSVTEIKPEGNEFFRGPSGTVYGAAWNNLSPRMKENILDAAVTPAAEPSAFHVGIYYEPIFQNTSSCIVKDRTISEGNLPDFSRKGVRFLADLK